MAESQRHPSRRRVMALGRVVLGLAISVALAWLVVRGLDWGKVGDAYSLACRGAAYRQLWLENPSHSRNQEDAHWAGHCCTCGGLSP